jgi:hypothetical protein
LNLNDNLGFAQFLGQALVLPAEFLDLFLQPTAFRLGAALVRGQALENAGLALATPGDQVRGVQAFAAQKGADGAGVCGGGVGLSQDALFEFGREGPAPGVGDNLRVRSGRGGRLGGDGFARHCTPVGLAPLGLPTFRGGQTREGSQRDSVVLHIDSCSRPAQ